MSDPRPHLVVAESGGFDAEAAADLNARFRVTWLDADRPTLRSAIADADALWVRLRHQIDADLIAGAPRLAVLATPTTGHTHLDEGALAARGVSVCSLRGDTAFLRNIRATAEHTVLLMLAALRHLPGATRSVTDGRWDRDAFRGGEISSRTVGIVGWDALDGWSENLPPRSAPGSSPPTPTSRRRRCPTSACTSCSPQPTSSRCT